MKRLTLTCALVSLFGLGVLPVLPWLQEAWLSSPMDRPGLVQAACALLVTFALSAVFNLEKQELTWNAAPFMGIGVFILGFGYWSSVNSLYLVALLFLVWTTIWWVQGIKVALVTAPILTIGVLGVPTLSFQLDQLRVGLGLADISLVGFMTLIVVALSLTMLIVLGCMRRLQSAQLDRFNTVFSYGLSFAFLLFASQFALNSAAVGPAFSLQTDQYRYGNWLGADISLTPAEARFFSGSAVTKRVYAQPSGERIALLSVESSDIRQLHSPEYCWTGSGWKVVERTSLLPEQANNPINAASTRLSLERSGERIELIYWFSTDQFSSGEIADLRLRSSVSPEDRYQLHILTSVQGSDSADLVREFIGAVRS